MNQSFPSTDFTIPARQSSAAILIFIIKFANQTVRKAWAGLVPLYLALRKASLVDWQIFLMVAVVVSLYFLFSYLSYQRFFYYVKGDEIIIEKGVLYRKKISLPFNKIQTINFKENILHQVLGVTAVQIDAAGSKTEEISVEALSKSKANAFRDYVMKRKDAVALTAVDTVNEEQQKEIHEVEASVGNTLLKLGPVDLFKVGISQNHLRSMLIFTVFVWNIYDQISKQLEKQFEIDNEEKIQEFSNFVGSDILGRLGIFVIVVLLLSLIVSMGITFFKHFNFQLLASSVGFKKHFGLFERREQSATFNKIQSISWGDNPVKKLFGLFVVKLYPASSGETTTKKSIQIPGAYRQHVDAIIEELYGSQNEIIYTEHKKSTLFLQRGFFLFALFPGILLSIILYIQYDFMGLFGLLWIPFCYLFLLVHHKKWRLFMSENLLRVQSGIFSHQYKMIDIRKIQAVTLKQSPYEKRKDLGALELHSAGRNIVIDFLPLPIIKQLESYILYKIESSTRSWM